MNTLQFIFKKFNLSFSETTPLPIQLPTVEREDLAVVFKELGFTKGAEIGVYRGAYSRELCAANPHLKLYAIDPWGRGGYLNRTPDYSQAELERSYVMAKTLLRNYTCTLVRKTSMEALKDFPDESLDFVYIDSDHTYANVILDIAEWTHKVRTGGIVAGHDFVRFKSARAQCHVVEAVTGYTAVCRIKPWFVLGGGPPVHLYRSWMFIKT